MDWGVFGFTDGIASAEFVARAGEVERQGYRTLWIPELAGREPFAAAGYLLASTETLRIATGIANIHVRDATAALQASHTLAEFSGGRFTLGLGVSHPALIEPRGHAWRSPREAMAAYLESMDHTTPESPAPDAPAPRILAAHGPKMLELAGERADGAMLYLMPPERVALARKILGPDKSLVAILHCSLCTDAARAREVGRQVLQFYLSLPNYHGIWRSCGYSDRDFGGTGTDKLIDGLFAWGSPDTIRGRAEVLFDAGADEVALASFDANEPLIGGRATAWRFDWKLLDALAPASG